MDLQERGGQRRGYDTAAKAERPVIRAQAVTRHPEHDSVAVV